MSETRQERLLMFLRLSDLIGMILALAMLVLQSMALALALNI